MTSPSISLPADTVVRAVTGHWLAEVAQETVLLHRATAQYFGLNEVGTRVWALLTNGASVEELCQAVAREYGLSPDHVRGDLVPFLQDLVETGLAEIVSESGRPAV